MNKTTAVATVSVVLIVCVTTVSVVSILTGRKEQSTTVSETGKLNTNTVNPNTSNTDTRNYQPILTIQRQKNTTSTTFDAICEYDTDKTCELWAKKGAQIRLIKTMNEGQVESTDTPSRIAIRWIVDMKILKEGEDVFAFMPQGKDGYRESSIAVVQ